ncbi:MAG TPA: YfiR family protein [Rudaea sp.]|nr:YfiR family protein [Rudaea sp.]HSC10580.1 YfiR family protein [Rhodanobacteraceae bacterium]
MALLLLCAQVPASAQVPMREPEIEAAYLVNFLRYTQWPEQSFVDARAPFVLTLICSDEDASSVRAVAQAAGLVNGRPIEVHVMPPPRSREAAPDAHDLEILLSSHVVFFHKSAGSALEQELRSLSGQPVLTVSDLPGFTSRGGMLELVSSGGRMVFEANTAAIREAGLVVSAKVLKLARSSAELQP